MWLDVFIVGCLSILLVEVGLVAYFVIRRRWIMLVWLAGGLLLGIALGGSLASTIIGPWAENNLAIARAHGGFASGLLAAFTFARATLLSLAGAALGALLGGVFGLWLGHRQERRVDRRRIRPVERLETK